MQGISRRYWLKLVFEAYRLSKYYIQYKKYNMNVCISMYVKIKEKSSDKTLELKDIKSLDQPFLIILYKTNLSLFNDIIFSGAIYSKELSDLYGMTVYKYHYEDDADDIWCLYLT